MNPLIQLKKTAPVFLVALVCFGLLPAMQAVTPAPDGGYPGGNTAEGQSALLSLTTGGFNTGVGFFSLRSDATGQLNTAIGAGTLLANTADQNTATGAGALLSTTSGGLNTAVGTFALFHNTTAGFNTANGVEALFSNTTGISNTATGGRTLISNTTGNDNTATGFGAIASNTTDDNTATGFAALYNNTTGLSNTAVGASALFNNITGTSNIALRASAGLNVTTADNVICIGAAGQDVSNSCYIGEIFNATSSGEIAVFINSDGKLGTATSSRRFKEEIQPMERVSEALFALKPVTFRYKKGIDPQQIAQFGLVAEDVERVNCNLIVRDKEGKPYTVRYDAVNAMLLNEFLKEHRKTERLEAAIAQQQKQIEALTTGLQKVSAQLATASPSLGGLEASKFAIGRIRRGGPAPQVVNNP